MLKLIMPTFIILSLVGCSTHMRVTQHTSNTTKTNGNSTIINKVNDVELSGIPFRIPKPMVFEYKLTQHSKGGKCNHVETYEIIPVSGDELYYFSIHPKTFANSSLTVKYHENGFIQELNFSTEPDSEAVDSATGALSTLLPFVGALPKQKSSNDVTEVVSETTNPDGSITKLIRPTAANQDKSCDVGKKLVRIVDLQKYFNEKS